MYKVNIGPLSKTEVSIKNIKKRQTLGWQISKYKFPKMWAKTKGAGIKVAVLDTAVDLRHPDLKIAGGYDFVNNRDINYYKTHHPKESHGTHVAGIIGARNNKFGIVGVAPECELYSCAVLGDDGSGDCNDIIKAINWCIKERIDVINMSLGGGADFKQYYKAIRRAYDANIPIVCAGGNSNWETGYLDFPGTYNETIAVASINSKMKRSVFSSIGSNIDIAAPGSDILSCTPKNTYSIFSGTSMATPFVAGLIALIIAKHRTTGSKSPVITVEDVREHLTKTAIDVDFKGQDSYTGHGLINPLLSMNYDGTVTVKYSDLINGNLKLRCDRKVPRKSVGKSVIPKGKIVNTKFNKSMIERAIVGK